ncbi:MAG: translocation/assembly module TamB domain-containing protein [Acetobacteraceae bacterium]
MRRALKWIAGILLTLIAIPIVLLAIVLIGANTEPGRRLIENVTDSVTAGTVQIEGLAGRFPDALRIARITVADQRGVYLAIHDVVLDWSPTSLFGATADIDRLTADLVDLQRLPESSSQTQTSGGSTGLPVRVQLDQLHVNRLVLREPVAGQAATLTVDGSAALQSLTQGDVKLTLTEFDAPAGVTPSTYRVDASLRQDGLRATLAVQEHPQGLIAGLAGLPDLGAISVDARVQGPMDALATTATLAAGPLNATIQGTVDTVHQAANLKVAANAPAMTPAPEISWQAINLDGTVEGPFTQPNVDGTLAVDALHAAGAVVSALRAGIKGNAGEVRLNATAEGVQLPGAPPDLLAGAPLTLVATARLDAPERPVTFTLAHPVLTAQGNATTGTVLSADVNLAVDRLAPLAAIGGVDLQGQTRLHLTARQDGEAIDVGVQGTLGVTGGLAPVPALIGEAGRIDLAATLRGNTVTIQRLSVDGKALNVAANGSASTERLALDWSLRLLDVSALQPTLRGELAAQGTATGPADDFAVTANLSGDIGTEQVRSGQFTAHVTATGLPGAPQARIEAEGTLLDAPLSLALGANLTQAGAINVQIDRASWKSLQAGGSLALPAGTTVPLGTLQLSMNRLADLAPLVGQPVSGSLSATLNSDAGAARLSLQLRDAAFANTAKLGQLKLDADVKDPLGSPVVDATLAVDNAVASGFRGSATASAQGPLQALEVKLTANAPEVAGAAARVQAAGTLNVTDSVLRLASLTASWNQQDLRLLAPTRIGYADGVSVDQLRLGYRQAEIFADGRVGTTLDLTARIRNLPADIAAIVAPDYAADGTISAEARLTGTPARPEGTVEINASGLHLRSGPGESLPPASVTADARLMGSTMRLNARLTAGSARLTVAGTAPLGTEGALDLKLGGNVNLALLDPILTAQGRRVRGRVTLDAAVGGTIASPAVTGSARLANGELQDYTFGAHITDITAVVEGNGDTIRLTRLTGRAGPGTVSANGTVGLTGAMPIDLQLSANNARPIASEILTALIDLSMRLQGQLQDELTLSGTLTVQRAEIRVPEKLPANIATIPVRTAGEPPPPPPAPTALPTINLNIVLNAPRQVFIRGRGLDVELGGRVVLRGTAANPVPTGGLQLRRGTISVIGQTLNLTEGTIDFSGGGLANPSLKLVASVTTANLIANLTVSGSAKDPKITLSSVPEMPQDEILAQLLFQTSTSRLSPFQLAQIAAALAELSGATGGLDPLGKLRQSFGLDRLSVGSNQAGDPTIEAGRYVAPGVYLGAKQSTTGGAPQASVQVDIAKGLKLEGTAGSRSTSATGAGGAGDAASVGLKYQFEY